MKRIALVLGLLSLSAACTETATPPAPPPPPPPAPILKLQADAGTPRDASADRKLTQMEIKNNERLKRKAEEEALAAQLAAEEAVRLKKFDKGKLPKHQALFAFETKARKQLEDAATSLKGKPDAEAQLVKLAASMRKGLEAQAKVLKGIDPQGGNSNIATDHDVVLNMLANDYPEAIGLSFKGDAKPLADVRAEMDKREKKISGWLDELKKK
jgi:hypothetical protein